MRLHHSLLGAVLVALLPATAVAQTDPAPRSTTEGTVLAIDSGDLVVDLGTARGAHEGQLVELWRPIRVKHPVSGKVLTDRFRIAAVRLTQVQNTLSLAKVEGTVLRPPAAGDQILMHDGVPAKAPDGNREATKKGGPTPWNPVAPPVDSNGPAPAAPTSAKVIVAADPDAQAVADLFDALRGVDPEGRATAYETFVRARPKSRFATVLHEEANALRSRAKAEDASYETSFAPVRRLRPGAPQRFAVELDVRFVGAVLHVRKKDSAGYRSVAMSSVGPRYWSATLPGDAVDQPAMEYFIEGVPKTGAPVAVVGGASAPKEVTVDPLPLTGKKPGTLAQAAIATEIASFNTKKANDYVFQTEGTFGWRLGDLGIRAVRSGFGVLRGKGGTLADLDVLGKDPKSVGLTYGYVEAEIGLTPEFSLIGRPIIGLRDGGVAGGAQAFFRIGNDLKTNLSVGGEVLGTVGLRGIVQLDWRTVPRVPIVLRSEVTNQPAGVGTDVGARAIAQVGYELTRELTVSARGSYQGRTINHAGPGAGLGVSYQW